MLDVSISSTQKKAVTILSFSKPNTEYVTREILRFTGAAVKHDDMRLHNEFLPIGFGIIHKNQALEKYSAELLAGYQNDKNIDASEITHRFYWQTREIKKIKPNHPSENDSFIPIEIRGRHYNSWRQIAKDLGYGE